MGDEELLEAFGQMMDVKLAQQRKEIMHDVAILMENEVTPKFNLLAEGLDILNEKLPGTEELEEMQEQLDLHYAMLKKHTREITDLKKAN